MVLQKGEVMGLSPMLPLPFLIRVPQEEIGLEEVDAGLHA